MGLGVSVEYLLDGQVPDPSIEHRRKVGYSDNCQRCEELERQLDRANETIASQARTIEAMQQGRAGVAPVSGAIGGDSHVATEKLNRMSGA